MRYCFDIDGTICTNTEGDYHLAQPFFERIEAINQLYKNGHTILFFTARGSTTGIDWKEATQKQLKKWKVQYHELCFGKPMYDIHIDDRSMNADDFFSPRSKKRH